MRRSKWLTYRNKYTGMDGNSYTGMDGNSYTGMDRNSYTRMDRNSYTGMDRNSYTRMDRNSYTCMDRNNYTGMNRNSYTGMYRNSYTWMDRNSYTGMDRNSYTVMDRNNYTGMDRNSYTGMDRNSYTGMDRNSYTWVDRKSRTYSMVITHCYNFIRAFSACLNFRKGTSSCICIYCTRVIYSDIDTTSQDHRDSKNNLWRVCTIRIVTIYLFHAHIDVNICLDYHDNGDPFSCNCNWYMSWHETEMPVFTETSEELNQMLAFFARVGNRNALWILHMTEQDTRSLQQGTYVIKLHIVNIWINELNCICYWRMNNYTRL